MVGVVTTQHAGFGERGHGGASVIIQKIASRGDVCNLPLLGIISVGGFFFGGFFGRWGEGLVLIMWVFLKDMDGSMWWVPSCSVDYCPVYISCFQHPFFCVSELFSVLVSTANGHPFLGVLLESLEKKKNKKKQRMECICIA